MGPKENAAEIAKHFRGLVGRGGLKVELLAVGYRRIGPPSPVNDRLNPTFSLRSYERPRLPNQQH
jgi:hypothetical protein